MCLGLAKGLVVMVRAMSTSSLWAAVRVMGLCCPFCEWRRWIFYLWVSSRKVPPWRRSVSLAAAPDFLVDGVGDFGAFGLFVCQGGPPFCG